MSKDTIRAYIKSLRNAAKRRYAAEYAVWMLGPANDPVPERGELSYMAAQAVRLTLEKLAGGVTTND